MSKTIKIIDLLNKIANGEKVPKKIGIGLKNYHFCNACGVYEDEYERDLAISYNMLNDEVEIIEEQEEIDKLEIDENGFIHTNNGSWKGRKLDVAFAKSINKLVEEVKNIKEKQ